MSIFNDNCLTDIIILCSNSKELFDLELMEGLIDQLEIDINELHSNKKDICDIKLRSHPLICSDSFKFSPKSSPKVGSKSSK